MSLNVIAQSELNGVDYAEAFLSLSMSAPKEYV